MLLPRAALFKVSYKPFDYRGIAKRVRDDDISVIKGIGYVKSAARKRYQKLLQFTTGFSARTPIMYK